MSKKQSTSETEGIGVLEKLDKYIMALARKKLPRYVIRPGELDLEIDELAQQSRIKLWLALQRGYVINPVGYVRSIVSTESVDMQRRFKPTAVLSQELSDQLYGDRALEHSWDVERDEDLAVCVARAVQAIRVLPARQKLAMVCALKDAREDAHPLLVALQAHGIDVEGMHWPDDKVDMQRLRASLSISRKKVRNQLCG